MRIVIVGDGKVGLTLTAQLSKEGHDIVIIDNNPKVLQQSVEQYDVLGVLGNGASLAVQREAGVEFSDLLIAATSADEVNLLCCVIARKLGVKGTIARVRNPEYSEQLVDFKDELGLTMAINPERAAGLEILNLLHFPAAVKRDTFANGRVEIIELKVGKDSPLNGRYLHELSKIAKVQVLVCAVERDGKVYIPTGQFQLQEGDNIHVTGAGYHLVLLVRRLKFVEFKIKNVVLIGGSRVAFYLAKALMEEGCTVKIIEMEQERCNQLAEMLPQVQVIHGDGSQPELWKSEGLDKADALVTLTSMDEENVVLSMYGIRLNLPKVITKINRIEYSELFRDMGLGSIVSPKQLVCNEIVRYVRAMQNSAEDNTVLTLHRLVDDQVEALEFRVTEDTLHVGEPFSQIRLKPDILIACINRGGKIIIPNGRDCLKHDDSVVIVTTADRMYSNLNLIFDSRGPIGRGIG